MTDRSVLLATGGIADWAYDPVREILYISGGGSIITRWSVTARDYLPRLEVGGNISGFDISQDGRFLLGGERAARQTAPIGADPSYENVLVRVDLTSGASERFTFSAPREDGVGRIVFGLNEAFISTHYPGSGDTRVHNFNPTTAKLDGLGDQLVVDLASGHGASPYLYSSDSGRYVLAQSTGQDARLYMFDTAQNRIVAQNSSLHTFHHGRADISEEAGLIADISGYLYILDFQLRVRHQINIYSVDGGVAGVKFSASGHHLFVWERGTQTIKVLEVINWTKVGSIDLSSYFQSLFPPTPAKGGMMLLDDGQFLALQEPAQIIVLDLAHHLHINVTAGAADDTVFGAIGDDRLFAGDGRNFVRALEGQDSVVGGADFDDLHGGPGDDTVRGGAGDDWVVGGQGQDLLFGDDGGDVVLGNLGQDTLSAGDGDDVARGGQGDDSVSGDLGNDWLAGDRGSDTLSGGAGADTFHSFGAAGLDVVLDFNAAEGDRVQLEAGTQWTVSQVGADTVVEMAGGGRMVLVGVAMNLLPSGWIFAA